MKFLADQSAATFDAVQACYSGPEQSVWELTMGKQIDIGAASSTMELAKKAGVGPGMKGVELNCNNGGGMRCLVRLCGVDSMTGVDMTKKVVETGRQRTEEEGLSDRITFINANSLANGLPDGCADFVYSKDAWCYIPDKQQIIDQAARIVKPGGTIMFTDWIEGEGLSDEEAQRYLSLMTFPAIPTVEEYAAMLEKAGCTVKVAENSGRFSPAMDCYTYMLKYQAVYDAKKLLGWDENAYQKLISDFEFMQKLAAEGKIIQGMFVATKGPPPRVVTMPPVYYTVPSTVPTQQGPYQVMYTQPVTTVIPTPREEGAPALRYVSSPVVLQAQPGSTVAPPQYVLLQPGQQLVQPGPAPQPQPQQPAQPQQAKALKVTTTKAKRCC